MALSRDRDLPRVRGRHRATESNYGSRLIMCLTLPGRTSALMPQGNVRPSESACGRPTPPPLGCVRSRQRRAWPASAHVWDRTARSGTRLLCPSITIGVAVVRVCATGFQPPWAPGPSATFAVARDALDRSLMCWGRWCGRHRSQVSAATSSACHRSFPLRGQPMDGLRVTGISTPLTS